MDIQILCIDDEDTFLELTKTYLENSNEGFNVTVTSSVNKALALLEDRSFDAIVSDYKMPELDGLELLKIIRQEKSLLLPFIMFTGKGREEVAIKALNLGANRYVQKGGKPEVQYSILADAIKQAVKYYRSSQELKKVEERLDLAIKGAQLGVWDWNTKTNEVVFNNIWAEMLGYKLEEIDNTLESWSKLLHPEDKAYVYRNLDKHLSGETEIYSTEHRLKTKNGSYKWILDVGKVFERDKREQPLRAVGIHLDIDDQKKALIEAKKIRESLKESEERYRNFFKTSRDATFITSVDGKWIDMNDAAVELFGFKNREELMQNEIANHYKNPEDRKKHIKKIIEEGYTKEYPVDLQKKDGSTINTLITSVSIKDENGSAIGFQGTIRDITEKKYSEQKIKEKEERYRNFFMASVDPTFITSIDGKWINMNDAVVELFGFESKNELMQVNVVDLYVDPKDRLTDNRDFIKEFPLRLKKKDGSIIHVLLTSVPIKNEEGEVKGFQGTLRDVTEQNRIEKRKSFLQYLLLHDVNNKSQIVEGYLEFISENFDLNEEAKVYLEKARKNNLVNINLVKKVSTLLELDKEKVMNIDIAKLISEVIENYTIQAKRKGFDIQFSSSITNTKVKAGLLLDAVFSNLIENAIKHSKGTKISITAEEKNSKVQVKIEDDGRGIPKDNRNTLFDRIQTNERKGDSKLGLFLVKEIVDSYGGKIEIKDSELGGASFEITLNKV